MAQSRTHTIIVPDHKKAMAAYYLSAAAAVMLRLGTAIVFNNSVGKLTNTEMAYFKPFEAVIAGWSGATCFRIGWKESQK